jgi:hypothetical protein
MVIVRDDNNSFALRIQFVEHLQNLGAAFGVEISGGFIGQNNQRVVGQRTGNGDSLLLAAGQLKRAVMHAVGQSHAFSQHEGTLTPLMLGNLLIVHGNLDIFEDVELADEIE